MNYNGTVQKVSSFDFNGSKLWSFTLHGTRGFFRTGKTHPGIEPNQLISFEGQADGKGNVKVESNTIQLSKTQESTGVGSAVGGGAELSVPASEDRRYQSKAEREALQQRIELQSCRNSALELAALVLQYGEVKFGAKTDKVAAIEEMVQHYTDKFVSANSGGGTDAEAA